jgi:hypothetical protein
VYIADISGRVLYKAQENGIELKVNMSNYNPGIYTVNIVSQKGAYKVKVSRL